MQDEQITIPIASKIIDLARVSSYLAENGINIRTMHLTDSNKHCLLRLIVNDTDKACQILRQNNFSADISNVIVVEVMDKPGGLATVLDIIKSENVEIDYLYALFQRSGECGLMILESTSSDDIVSRLTKAGLRILSGEEVYTI